MSGKVDRLDLRIISMLQCNGRESNRRIAAKLGVNEATVRKRIARLLEENIIQIVAVADPRKIGFNIPATVKVRADIKSLDSVGEELSKIDSVWYIAQTTGLGEFDIDVITRGTDELHDLLYNKIYRVKGITSTETSIILDFIKKDYHWLKALE